MDLTGSLVDTNLKIYPGKNLVKFLESLNGVNNIPINVLKFAKSNQNSLEDRKETKVNTSKVHLTDKDIQILNKVKSTLKDLDCNVIKDIPENEEVEETLSKSDLNHIENLNKFKLNKPELYLHTCDIDWLYNYLNEKRNKGEENVPYLHVLLEGVNIEMPENRIIKRNPVLEARCVKLRAQQEAREYRKMTKSVDNVRLKYPEDSISYQLKQVNRQLIAIGQFIISIFAGFLFGFQGIEWLVGNLEFGFRLLLGVMCALVIALAEIYFLAKRLNEELNIAETVQLGGPLKFANDAYNPPTLRNANIKEHQE